MFDLIKTPYGPEDHGVPFSTMLLDHTEIPVLNDGHVQLIGVMGDDSTIDNAARVSYGKGTRKVSKRRDLLRYLMSHRHTTPFEMCEMCVRIRIPMDAWRQMIRHRTANVNEYSTRYSEAIDARQTTLPDQWRLQSGTNKQGSTGFVTEWPENWDHVKGSNGIPGSYLTAREKQVHELSTEIYDERLRFGVAKEQARKDLPLSTYTEAYWKMDLHNLFHFLGLRLDSHAQLEIRCYAQAIAWFVKQWVPLAWEAFLDYRVNAMYLSGPDVAAMRRWLRLPEGHEEDILTQEGMSTREAAAFADKARHLLGA